mmetsp:Transcript_25559/g.67465  ORF Transcript_25559/g.67465 Transcript_25559/m.67465 type:complete len:242 (+) Transcript_25559:27-752(+)
MSSMRVICEKIKIWWSPSALSLLRMRSSSCILPEAISRTSSTTSRPSASTGHSKRYGWLQHLRSCISTFCSRTCLPELSVSCLLSRSWYIFCCQSESHANRMYSCFLGRPISTSALSRRSRNGRRIWWSLVTTEFWSSPCTTFSSLSSLEKSKSNHAWNESRSSKMSGSRKLSSDHSSVRLFCSGVPVRSSRKGTAMRPSDSANEDASFLSRCPSSIVIVWKSSCSAKKASSTCSTSYVVR